MPDRSADIQNNLDLLYEQLAGKEKAFALAPQEEKVRLRQHIAALKQDINQFEAELENLQGTHTETAPQPIASGTGGATQTIAGGTGYQINQPQGPVIQGSGNQVSITYQSEPAGQSPQHPSPKQTQTESGGSRVQQLRRDRLQRELDQLAEEYQAVSDQLSVSLNPTDQVRLKRSLEQLETRMAAIEADLD